MRQPPITVLFPTLLKIYAQDNSDGTWTSLLGLPLGDGKPYTARTMQESVRTAAIANGYKPLPGEVIIQ